MTRQDIANVRVANNVFMSEFLFSRLIRICNGSGAVTRSASEGAGSARGKTFLADCSIETIGPTLDRLAALRRPVVPIAGPPLELHLVPLKLVTRRIMHQTLQNLAGNGMLALAICLSIGGLAGAQSREEKVRAD